MRLLNISFSVLCFLVFTTSCSYFERSKDTKVIYTVKLNKIDVKNSGSQVIGSIYKGDTIVPDAGFNMRYTVSFNYKGIRGFVNEHDLDSHIIPNIARVSNMQLSGTETIIRNYLNDYVNWRTGRFWLITLILIVSSFILIKLGVKLEDYLYYNFDFDDFKPNKLPYLSGIIGGLFSVVYMFSRESVLQAMFVTKFYWFPVGNSWLHWYLWTISLVGIVGLLFFWVKDFVHYGIRGFIPVLYFTFSAIITFNLGLFGGIAAILFAGYWIVSSFFSSFKFGSSSYSRSSNEKTEDEKMQYFYRQKEIEKKEEIKQVKEEIDDLKRNG